MAREWEELEDFEDEYVLLDEQGALEIHGLGDVLEDDYSEDSMP